MDVFLAIASYVILWWLAFFIVLPIGARSPHEAGEAVEAGNEPGAPKAHGLALKAGLAALLAAVVWAGAVWAFLSGLVSLRP
jgi:predicted secreted protein